MSDSERHRGAAPHAERSEEEKLTPAQERAVSALLSASTLEEAAKLAKVSPATLRRWRQTEPFDAAYRSARVALLDCATASLRRAATEAVDVLLSVMRDPDARAGDRIRAASIVLDKAYTSAELEDLAERIVALERDATEGGAGWRG